MPPPTLLIATRNAGKVREFAELLAGLPVTLRSLAEVPGEPPVVLEDETTYEGNAIKKARLIARWAELPALADDSGLEVDALGGQPGVLSARFGGPEQDSAKNVARLLAALRDTPAERRTARFRCIIAVARPSGIVLTTAGTCEGRITTSPCGTAGFGYDPVFLYPPLGRTFAELPAVVKNGLSHRAQACAALRPQLLPFLSGP